MSPSDSRPPDPVAVPRRWRTPVLAVAALVGAMLSLTGTPGAGAAAPAKPPSSPSIPGQAPAAPPVSAVEPSIARAAAPVWPAPVSGTVRLSGSPAAVAGSVVSVAAPRRAAADASTGTARSGGAAAAVTDQAASPGAVAVRTLDRSVIAAVGGVAAGAVLTRADGVAGRGPVAVSIDYSGFRYAYGGDFAGRVTLVSLPACALTTPEADGCRTRTYLHAANDQAAGRVTATVQVGTDTTAAGSAMTVVALAATPSSGAGDYRATDLSQTGTWAVSTGSGSFTYSVPITAPPAPVGKTPSVKLDYDSQSIDGLTSATNNQAGWVGMGWKLNDSFVQRHYRSCKDDGESSSNSELCWDSPNTTAGTDPGFAYYTITLNGVSAVMVKDPANANLFHLSDDPGWQIQHMTGGHGADDEYWVVSTPDGSRYYLGWGRDEADSSATNSVWTAPVFGNDPGEPCYTTGTLSPCTQAWRWNLDRVIDANEVESAYKYNVETNNYYSTLGSDVERAYDRGGNLLEIDYGWATQITGSTFTDKITFNNVNRCLTRMAATDPIRNTDPVCPTIASTPSDYPDVPTDLICAAGDSGKCASHADAPVFFTTQMLLEVSTWTLNQAGTDWDHVLNYTLRHSLVNPTGTVTRHLWLDYIQRKTYAGGTSLYLPVINFDGSDIDNEVGSGELNFHRVTTVHTDLGGTISVTYGHQNTCDATHLPTEANNTMDCFRQQWTPEGGSQQWGWFKKWLVKTVVIDPRVGYAGSHDGDPVQTYTYDYSVGKPGWRFPEDPTMRRDDESWNEWRGYSQVIVTTGSAAGKSSTHYWLYQGLDGDRKVKAPASDADYKSVTVTGTAGVSSTDYSWAANKVLETETLDSAGTAQEHTIHHYWATTIAAYPGVKDGRFIREDKTTTRTKISTSTTADTTWRERITDSTFDMAQEATKLFGLPVRSEDLGQTGGAADERCVVTTYAFNTDQFSNSSVLRFMALPQEVKHYGAACATASTSNQDSDVVTLYDSAAGLATNKPTDGNATETDTYLNATSVVKTKATYDTGGRILTATDGRGNTTTTAYSPAANWPWSGTKVTTPVPDPTGTTGSATAFSSTTYRSQFDGQTTRVTDANGHDTRMAYDTAGRLLSVWMPAESASYPNQPATMNFTYTIPTAVVSTVPDAVTGPAVTVAKTLQAAPSTYLTSATYVDGNGRVRETQDSAADGSAGRIVTVTRYDDAGRSVGTSSGFFNASAPGSGMLNPTLAAIPAFGQSILDYAGRVTESQLLKNGVLQPQQHAYTAYHGDYVTTTSPTGSVGDAYSDVFGNVTSVVQHTPDLTPASITTQYTYTPAGALATIVDAGNHTSRYTYDWAGHELTSSDPDAGATSSTYDANGNVVATVDAKNVTLSTVYDAMNRRTAVWSGAAGTGTKLTAFTYDTAPGGKGVQASASAITGAGTYTRTVDGYDADGRNLGNTVTIPSGEGALAGTYDTKTAYDAAGHVVGQTFPAVGGLPAETVTAAYVAGRASTLSSPLGSYVASTAYANYGPMLGRVYGTATQGVNRSFTWDQTTGRITNITTQAVQAGVATTAQSDTYSFDNGGNVVQLASTAGPAQQQCYSYDSLSRLTSAYTATAAAVGPCGSTPADHTGGVAPYDLAYHYDALGDITSVGDNVTGTTSTYTYGDTGHVHAVTDVARTGGAGGHDSFAYDLNGDETSRAVTGGTATLAWDVQHHLASSTVGTAATRFTYDADGTRLLRKDPSTAVLYLPGQELRLTGGTVTATRYYTSGGAIVAMRVGDTSAAHLSWLTSDGQGSTQVTVNGATGAYTQQRYLPYGKQRGTQGPAAGTDRGFLGKNYDSSTGLVAAGARYYDPAVGAFVSPDPLSSPANPQTLDAYAYSTDDPVNGSDASGLMTASQCATYLCYQQIMAASAADNARSAASCTTQKCHDQVVHSNCYCNDGFTVAKKPGVKDPCDSKCGNDRLKTGALNADSLKDTVDAVSLYSELLYQAFPSADISQLMAWNSACVSGDASCPLRVTFTTETGPYSAWTLLPNVNLSGDVFDLSNTANPPAPYFENSVSKGITGGLGASAPFKGVDIGATVDLSYEKTKTKGFSFPLDNDGGKWTTGWLSVKARAQWTQTTMTVTYADGAPMQTQTGWQVTIQTKYASAGTGDDGAIPAPGADVLNELFGG
ncbi:RHS repeat domain-containing protein [Hamadaea tsunoensis]|uniref:RHS repeat domain-containing protein n=1 Tax=Hamadaea tsunoensis TaxID=53368 RepID=UPI0004257C9C|nr:RHS repeat-associated core domain-containing protein [Hamadaea tsunoensis]